MYSLPKSRAVTIVSLITIIIGAFVIISWLLRLPSLETFLPQYVSMRFNTALCFLFTGGALFITQTTGKKNTAALFVLFSALTAFIGALSLSQNIFNYNAGIDQLLVTDHLAIAEKYRFPGRMAPNVAFCFLLTGLALLGVHSKSRMVNVTSQYAFHLVTAISVIAILGYLYNITLFYNLSFVASMAVHTAVLLFFISVTATLLQPELGVTSLFTGDLVGNRMARKLFVLTVFVVIIFGELRVLSQHYHLLSAEVGIPLLVVCFLAASLLIIWYTARGLNQIDRERYEAEEEIKVMNEELEERVGEGTTELLDLLEKYRESESKFRSHLSIRG